MKKRMFGLLLVALCVMPMLASAQEPPVTNEYGFLSSPSILSNISIGSGTSFLATAAQALGDFGTTAVSALPEILAGRRSYTPPIDMTTVLSAQY